MSIDRPKALRIAKKLKPKVLAALKQAAKEASSHLHSVSKGAPGPQDKAEAATLVAEIDLAEILAEMQKPLEEALAAVGEDVVKAALVQLGIDKRTDIVDRVNQRAVDYAEERAAELVALTGDESLVASTRNMLRDLIARGLSDNIGHAAIADSIEEAAAFSEFRAELITNTEIAFANSYAKNETWQEVMADGVELVKQWWVSEDEGVCEECEGNAAQGEIPYDDEFDSGDDMEPAHPNCRCVTVARAVSNADDESGDEE